MQIALTLGISRDTVRRYQRMSEKEFEGLISSEVLRRKRKLEAFEGFIKELLQDAPFLSAAQIFDRLKENFPDLPEVSERTVYNTVHLVREREDLPKTLDQPARWPRFRIANTVRRPKWTSVRNGCATQRGGR